MSPSFRFTFTVRSLLGVLFVASIGAALWSQKRMRDEVFRKQLAQYQSSGVLFSQFQTSPSAFEQWIHGDAVKFRAFEDTGVCCSRAADDLAFSQIDLAILDQLRNLEKLAIRRKVQDLSVIARLTNLKHVDLGLVENDDWSPLCRLKRLESVVIRADSRGDLPSLTDLRQMKALEIHTTKGIPDLSPLATLEELEELVLDGITTDDLSPLARLKHLRRLTLVWSVKVENQRRHVDLAPIGKLSTLKCLELDRAGTMDLERIAPLTHLKRLRISNSTALDYSSLSHFGHLRGLNLRNSTIENLSCLSRSTKLEEVDIAGTPVTTLNPLSCLSRLTWLDLNETEIRDLSPLMNNPNLIVFTKTPQVLDTTKFNGKVTTKPKLCDSSDFTLAYKLAR